MNRPELDQTEKVRVRRKRHREAQARYKRTAKGIITDIRYEATRRGSRG